VVAARVVADRVVIVPAIIGLVLLCFAWRTWHYTGVFSVFYGTQRYIVALWQPGAPLGVTLQRLTHSVMLVLTVNDPPRFDVYALPILIGAGVAAGSAYPGRFSIHVVPITCALAACGIARLFRPRPSDAVTADDSGE